MTAKNHRSDLQADLLADLSPIVEDLPSTPALPPLPPELSDATPTASVLLTPMRWSRPRLVRAEKGAGRALKLGPLRLEFSIRD